MKNGTSGAQTKTWNHSSIQTSLQNTHFAIQKCTFFHPLSKVKSSPSSRLGSLTLQILPTNIQSSKVTAKFTYLTEGGYLKPLSNPRLNGIDPTDQKRHHANSVFNTFFLYFSGNGKGEWCFPISTWHQERNALLRLALASVVLPGYDFLIFIDEDSFNWLELENVENPTHFWKQNLSINPYRSLVYCWCTK